MLFVTTLTACRSSVRTSTQLRAVRVDVRLGRGITGGHVEVLPGSVKSVTRAIDRAQDDIFLAMYILTDRRIIRALERAAAQGVRVWVQLEEHPIGMGQQPERVAQQLRAAGIYLRWSPKGFALMHAKYLVIDDRLAIISTANFSRSAFSTDRDFLIFDPDRGDVHEVSDLFRCDWNRTPAWLDRADLLVAPDNARQKLEALMRGARGSIDVYGEELADSRLEALLISLHARGVRVRVLLPAGASTPAVARLRRAGVPVRQPARPYIHAKYVGVDGREAYVGSENLSAASLDRNREVGVLLRGPMQRRIARRFELDWRQSG